MDPSEWNTNSLGTIPASIEIKLVDYPDAGYFTHNNPEQGEVWIRGEPVASSYFMNDEETKQAFEDGWFKTGDIGEWDENGHLKLIDRKKNLVKTLNGEYIALEKVCPPGETNSMKSSRVRVLTYHNSWSPFIAPRQLWATFVYMPMSRRQNPSP